LTLSPVSGISFPAIAQTASETEFHTSILNPLSDRLPDPIAYTNSRTKTVVISADQSTVRPRGFLGFDLRGSNDEGIS